MKRSFRSVTALFLCIMIVFTMLLTSCNSKGPNSGNNENKEEQTQAEDTSKKESDDKESSDNNGSENSNGDNNNGESTDKGNSEGGSGGTVDNENSGNENEEGGSSGNVDNGNSGNENEEGGSSGSESITVLPTVITLDKSDLSMVKGDNVTLTVFFSPSNVTDKTITWTTSDASVATVNNGTVSAVGEGEAVITAKTANGKEASCKVTVSELLLPSGLNYELVENDSFYMVTGYYGNAKEYTVPTIYDGLRVIGIKEGAFKDNTRLEKITISTNVQSIGAKAFAGCISLDSIEIPQSVTSLSNNLFEGCSSLKTINIHSKIKTIGDEAFKNCVALKSITFESGVKTIGKFAFDGCSVLESVVLPDTVTAVGNGAFRNSKNLKSIVLSNNMTAISNITFQNCESLEKITLHSNITSLGNSAFSYCYSLNEIEILGNITSFGDSTFYHCKNLENIYFASKVKGNLGSSHYIFCCAGIEGDGITLTIQKDAIIPEGLFEPFEEANRPRFVEIIFEVGTQKVDYFAEYGNLKYLKRVTIDKELEYISSNAFVKSSDITFNVVDENFDFIGWYDNSEFSGAIVDPTKYSGSSEKLYARCQANQKCVTVDKNIASAGSVKIDSSFDYNMPVTLSATTNYGYTFDGWYIDGTRVSESSSYTFDLTDKITVEARWNINSYGITLNKNISAAGSVSGAGSFEYLSQKTVTATTNIGYTFDGWYIDGTRVSTSTSYTVTVDKSLTIEARWKINSYSITMTKNISAAGDVSGAGSFEYLSKTTVTATTNYGYTFDGWYIDGRRVSTSTSYTVTVEKNLTIEARWEINSYGITLNKNISAAGDVYGAGAFEYLSSQTVTATTNIGYTFDGWYIDGRLVSTSTSYTVTVDKVLTIEARWTANSNTPYKVEHYIEKLDGGYELKETDNLSGTSDSVVTPAIKKYLGFISPDNQTVIISANGSQVVKYYYTRNSYNVTFVVNGGDAMASQFLKYQQNLPQATRTGYTFDGWYSDTKLSIVISTVPTQAITVYAKWTENDDTPYKVEHYIEKLDGGYELKETDNLSGTSDSEVIPNTKIYTGFTAPDKQNVTISADGSQVAKYYYTRNCYTVTFVVNGGDAMASQLLKYQQNLPQAMREGYTFDGWYSNTELSTAITTVPASDITVYAKWIQNSNTLYKVEHYIETLDGGYELKDIDNLFGISDSEVTPDTKDYEEFVAPDKQPVTVLADGSQVVKYYYTRNCYTVTFVTTSEWETESQFLKYQQNLPQGTREGYTFGGWYTDIELSTAISTVPANDITVYAYWTEENKPTDFEYSNMYGNITITGYKSADSSVVIPSYIGGVEVTSIGERAFYDCDCYYILTSVIIPDSVTNIGERAFLGCTLTSVTIGKNVHDIGEGAFSPGSVEVINKSSLEIEKGSSDFGGVALHTLEVHDGDTKIVDQDGYLFYTYDGVNYLVNYIGGDTQLILPENYNDENYEIYDRAFSYYYSGSVKSVTIPDSVTRIGESAFWASAIESITIGNRVTSIGNGAFSWCYSLTNITIPYSVTSIGSRAFTGCENLTSVEFKNPSDWMIVAGIEETELSYADLSNKGMAASYLRYDYQDYDWHRDEKPASIGLFYALNHDGQSYTVTGIGYCTDTDIVIPTTYNGLLVTEIAAGAFSSCENLTLTSVTIPCSVTRIGEGAFYDCSIYYKGTSEGWTNIDIDHYYFNSVENAIYYYSENEPTDTTYKYWRYVDGVPTPW